MVPQQPQIEIDGAHQRFLSYRPEREESIRQTEEK
jgi:hypothetical protein